MMLLPLWKMLGRYVGIWEKKYLKRQSKITILLYLVENSRFIVFVHSFLCEKLEPSCGKISLHYLLRIPIGNDCYCVILSDLTNC